MNTAIRTDSRRCAWCANRPAGPDIPSSGNRPMKRHMLLILTLISLSVVRGAELNPGRIRGEQTIEAGAVPAPIRNDLLPYGSTAVPYAFQWEYAEEANLGLGWLIIYGATSESYQPGALGKSTRYRRAAVYMDGTVQKRAYTNEVLVTVTPATQPLTPGSISGDQTVESGPPSSRMSSRRKIRAVHTPYSGSRPRPPRVRGPISPELPPSRTGRSRSRLRPTFAGERTGPTGKTPTRTSSASGSCSP